MGPAREPVVVDQVIGAFFLVRRALFETLGGFDERFFMYFEEVDFSKRAQMRGAASVYLGAARAFHSGGYSSRQVKASRLFYSLRSRFLYGFKHFRPAEAVAVLLEEEVERPGAAARREAARANDPNRLLTADRAAWADLDVLILTAIVVGVATTALGLALVVRINEEFGTIEEEDLEERELPT